MVELPHIPSMKPQEAQNETGFAYFLRTGGARVRPAAPTGQHRLAAIPTRGAAPRVGRPARAVVLVNELLRTPLRALEMLFGALPNAFGQKAWNLDLRKVLTM